jgi:hypothetical protein
VKRQALVDARLPDVRIIDMRYLGKEYKYDWNFLLSPGTRKNFVKIILGEANSLTTVEK